ncbi:MAG: helix-turn-helix transcriptional regulator [Clostridia bacterium]|nr:helix-turn-helix transcriptional regulator [Clostridia bacterium]MBO5755390.1 helix-turn-helix transcriptional regulator [Clostridia bacterium]MBO7170816.1 helix-turn-helix transcriptional regulator [Clostridia bacterium]
MLLPEIVAVGVYHSAVSMKNKKISPNRRVTMYEIELPIEEGGESFIDKERHPISPFTMVCGKPGQVRHTHFPYKCYYVHMVVSDPFLCEMLGRIPSFIPLKNTESYRLLFERMCRHSETATAEDSVLLSGLVLELIYTLSRDSARLLRQERGKSNEKVIEATLEYIKTHLTEDLSLQTVAEKMSFSPIHFHNCFRASTGKNLREYVEEKRIAKAIGLLLTTQKNLTEIAYECGFSSQAYFSYVFKRRMGSTPREYTRRMAERYEE